MTYWDDHRYKLKEEYEERGITRCENCGSGLFLGFAHRKKRREYNLDKSKLIDFNETALLCQECHDSIEYDKAKTKEMFDRLRGHNES